MKKLTALLLILSMTAFILAGCGDGSENGGGGGGGGSNNTSGGVSKLTGDDLYSELSMCIGSPDRMDTTELGDDSFTFTAMILSEVVDLELEDGTYKYVWACIARNDEDDFLIKVDGLSPDSIPEPEKIVKVTGSITGLIYTTTEGKQVKKLDIKASKIEPFTGSEPKVNEGPSINLNTYYSKGEYTFLGAHKASTNNNNVIVIYFNFKNTGDTDDFPLKNDFYFYYGDREVESDSGTPWEALSNALPANSGYPEKTYAGKTNLYYFVVRANHDVDPDEPIWIMMQDDDFWWTVDIGISVAESFEEFNAE